MSRAEKSFIARRRSAEAEVLVDALAAQAGGSVRRLDLAYRSLLARDGSVDGSPRRDHSVLSDTTAPSIRWIELLNDVRDALLGAARGQDDETEVDDVVDASAELVSNSSKRSIVIVAMFLRVTARTLDDAASVMVEVNRLPAPGLDLVETSTARAYETSSLLLRHVEEGTWRALLGEYQRDLGFEHDNIHKLVDPRLQVPTRNDPTQALASVHFALRMRVSALLARVSSLIASVGLWAAGNVAMLAATVVGLILTIGLGFTAWAPAATSPQAVQADRGGSANVGDGVQNNSGSCIQVTNGTCIVQEQARNDVVGLSRSSDSDNDFKAQLAESATGTASGPGPWPFVVVDTGDLGLFARTTNEQQGDRIGLATNRSVVWANCISISSYAPMYAAIDTGEQWIQVRWKNDAPSQAPFTSDPSDAGSAWMYARYLVPFEHDGQIPNCM